MEYFGLMLVAGAIFYLANKVGTANRIAYVRLRFEQRKAGWDAERSDTFEKESGLD